MGRPNQKHAQRAFSASIARVFAVATILSAGLGPTKADDLSTGGTVGQSTVDSGSVHRPLATGLEPIDAMTPIGRGQRALIIGDRNTGKTAVAVDAVLDRNGDIAISGSGERGSATVNPLSPPGGEIRSATGGNPVFLNLAGPDFFGQPGSGGTENGLGQLIIYDDLSEQAAAYRQISLILRRPSGREAYPGDVFYLHSRLLERAARAAEESGGVSLTALPIIETQSGDVSAYIPTNVISITDGQIYLETDLFYQGIRPAVDTGLSVSRVGGRATDESLVLVDNVHRTPQAGSEVSALVGRTPSAVGYQPSGARDIDSAEYGDDAVSGVVNVVTRPDDGTPEKEPVPEPVPFDFSRFVFPFVEFGGGIVFPGNDPDLDPFDQFVEQDHGLSLEARGGAAFDVGAKYDVGGGGLKLGVDFRARYETLENDRLENKVFPGFLETSGDSETVSFVPGAFVAFPLFYGFSGEIGGGFGPSLRKFELENGGNTVAKARDWTWAAQANAAIWKEMPGTGVCLGLGAGWQRVGSIDGSVVNGPRFDLEDQDSFNVNARLRIPFRVYPVGDMVAPAERTGC